MSEENNLVIVAVVAVVISLFGAFFTYNVVSNVKDSWVTGFASSGTLNLSVESLISVNFTVDNIDLGSGQVQGGMPNATINTAVDGPGNVSQGNWTNAYGKYWIIQNVGNSNLTLSLASDKNASELLGGNGPAFQINISQYEPGSCVNATEGFGPRMDSGYSLGDFVDVNNTSPGTMYCDRMLPHTTSDDVRVDVRLVVPSDSFTGALSATITATVGVAA